MDYMVRSRIFVVDSRISKKWISRPSPELVDQRICTAKPNYERQKVKNNKSSIYKDSIVSFIPKHKQDPDDVGKKKKQDFSRGGLREAIP